MKNKSIGCVVFSAFFSFLVFSGFAAGQTNKQRLSETILAKDAAFWVAYNKCDTNGFRQFFTDDVEFYHDKGGPTIGIENFMNALKNGLCGNPDNRLRREAVDGTVKIFPMERSNEIYGAIISGEHVFYVKDKDKPEYLDGRAAFTNLWLLKDGVWKMSRVFSYGHGPALQPKVEKN